MRSLDRKAIAGLNALGIDVWLPRHEAKEVQSAQSSSNVQRIRESNQQKNVELNIDRAERVKDLPPTRLASTEIPTSDEPEKVELNLLSVGRMAALFYEINPKLQRFLKDVAFVANDYKHVTPKSHRWRWPPEDQGFYQGFDSKAQRGLQVWINRACNDGDLVLAIQSKELNKLLQDIESTAIPIPADVKEIRAEVKLKIWNRLKSPKI